jgi:hypothetical protein
MYLPQRFLEKIVRRHVGDIPVYVSSALGVAKGSGRLFQHVAAAYKTPLSDKGYDSCASLLCLVRFNHGS